MLRFRRRLYRHTNLYGGGVMSNVYELLDPTVVIVISSALLIPIAAYWILMWWMNRE